MFPFTRYAESLTTRRYLRRAPSQDGWSGPAAPNEHRRPMTNNETACQACTMQPPPAHLPTTHAFIAFIAGAAATFFAFMAFMAGAAAATLLAFMAFMAGAATRFAFMAFIPM